MNRYLKTVAMVQTLKLALLLVLMSVSAFSFAQEAAQVSRVQRSIYVFNLAEQVRWPADGGTTFNIGVLGPDRTVIDFKAMAQKRQIKSLPVRVTNFLAVKDIKNIQILYVHSKYNFQMPYILQSIKGKGILVISEDYTFNAAMVNMVKVGNTFRHQINTPLLKESGFVAAPSLESFAIKSSEKWQSLFQQTQDSLAITKQRNRVKDSLIVEQEKEITSQNEIIDTIQQIVKYKDNSIQELLAKDEIQKKTIAEKRAIALALETEIENQIAELSRQDTILQLRAQEIISRQDSIESQKLSIRRQKEDLEKQSFELSLRENMNWLLGLVVLLLSIAGFVVYKSFRKKDALSKELIAKNDKITVQRESLRQKNEELEQFAYIASHDLQEPLNTISSFIGLIRTDYKDKFDDVGKQSLDFIQDASERMAKLIEVLLEYSRIGRDRDFTTVDSNQLVQDLEKDIAALITRKKATITYSNLPTVQGSEMELRLLFQNLITNALKFQPEGRLPVLKIDAIQPPAAENPQQQVWQFSFTDNGIGIRKDHQERIFSIFQRLHTQEEYEGTGIGLAHCKKIVTIHQGDLWLESEVGTGSTFYFTIPC
jgi:signal transduction histidine kinase